MTPGLIKTTSSSSTKNCLKKKTFRLCWAVVECSSADALFLLLPTADVLSEEAILKWYSDGPLTKGRSIFLEQMKKFVEWLKNAEEGKSPNASDSQTHCGRKGLVFISTQSSLCSMSHLFILSTCLESFCFYYFRYACVQKCKKFIWQPIISYKMSSQKILALMSRIWVILTLYSQTKFCMNKVNPPTTPPHPWHARWNASHSSRVYFTSKI